MLCLLLVLLKPDLISLLSIQNGYTFYFYKPFGAAHSACYYNERRIGIIILYVFVYYCIV